MAIVRELLIRLGFVTDKKAINETNNAITGFKTRFAIAATAASYAFTKLVSFFGDIATATLDSKELADSLGISLKELTALANAAQKFRIDPKDFQSALSKINKSFQDFKTGASGALAEIARQMNFEIDRDGGPVKVFEQILKYLSTIEDKTERIRIAGSVFGDSLAPRIAEMAVNLDEFNQSVAEFEKLGQIAQDSLPTLKKYEDAVNALSRAWGQFTLSISQTVFPVLQKIIEYLTIASDFYRTLFSGDLEGFKGTLKQGSKFLDPLFDGVKSGFNSTTDYLSGFLKTPEWVQSVIDYVENKPGYQYGMAGSASGMSPTITVNNDISVPLGTDSEMAKSIADSVSQGVEDAINRTFIDIQNNNPTVE